MIEFLVEGAKLLVAIFTFFLALGMILAIIIFGIQGNWAYAGLSVVGLWLSLSAVAKAMP